MTTTVKRLLTWAVVVLVVLVLTVLGLTLFQWLRARLAPVWTPTPDPQALLQLRNLSLGYLDNGDYAQAVPMLKELVGHLPGDPFGPRNLVIALFAPNDQGQGGFQAVPTVFAELEAAIRSMLRLEPDSAAAHLLAGRVYRDLADKQRGNRDEMQRLLTLARDAFRKAADLEPDDPAPHYDLYLLEVDFVNPDELTEEGMRALTAAARRVPNNLRAQIELALRQAEAEMPEVRGTLERVLNLLPAEERSAREELSKALELVPPGTPRPSPQAAQRIFSARNLLQQQPVFLDGLRDLFPHPLTFLIEDFQPASYDRLGISKEEQSGGDVRFETRALPAAVAPEPGPVVAIRLADLRGDGKRSWVVLQAGQGQSTLVAVDSSGHAMMPPLSLPGLWSGMHLADLDLDIVPQADANLPADLDLVVFGPGGVRIFEQSAAGDSRGWKDRTAEAGLPPLKNVRWLTACDVDHDGNLDLILGTDSGTRLLRNSGNWLFYDITDRTSGLADRVTLGGVFGDFDRDGDLDLYLITPTGLLLLDNLRGGRFRAVPIPEINALCLARADYNGDGFLDLLVGGHRGARLYFGKPSVWPHHSDQVSELPTEQAIIRAVNLDFNNDGGTDLALVLGTDAPGIRFLGMNHKGDLSPLRDLLTIPPDSPLARCKHCEWVQVVDADEDGDLDGVVIADGKPLLLHNEGGNRNPWLKVRIRAMLNRDATAVGRAARVNYYGIGSTLELRAGQHYALQVVEDTETHFGLGASRAVDTVRVVWTNGVPQVVLRPAPNAVITEEQRPKGSCPFLYAWNGREFEFVSDCLWSSALGMKLAEDVEMDHDRQDNYLIIQGRQLQPHSGRYVLQFTNELWEVPYLDEAELWVLDHPADFAVFTNQRIPPLPSSQFRLVVARERRSPVAARDHRGRDVLEAIRFRDGVFVGGFERRRYVGLAEPHFLELDLGDLSAARSATLFLTGWVWPTDTTGNVAISRDPRFGSGPGVVGGSQPPLLQVPDGQGGWTTLGLIGFPCGKMQTLAVPLSLSRFPDGDYRVRIATSMEIYWDEAFLSTDDPSADATPMRIQRLKPLHADLHDRGFGRPYQQSPIGPHLFAYDDVDRRPLWKILPGPYTRFGDVTALLQEADDKYVVMAPGDELTLHWQAVPSPEPGWTRTFLFFARGWLKDFDMNGASSESAAPFPFAGMSRYPYSAPEAHPHPRFLEEYLTRNPAVQDFWDRLRPSSRPQSSSSR